MADASAPSPSPHPLELRSLFLLRPNVVFLNHGAFGACPQPVFEVYQRWQLELEREPVKFLDRRFDELMRQAREPLAAYVGAAPDELVYVSNATTGLNLVARSLPLEPGDEVLATNHEYGAIDRTWRFVCRRRGAHYIQARLPTPVESAEQVAAVIWAAVTSKTRVLFLSHITSPTALLLPVDLLIQRAREAGIFTVIDGAHAPGHIPLNLTSLGADFYAGDCHKWLCAPKGSAFLYARRDIQHMLAPLIVSWGWEADDPGPSRFIDEQEWQGTRDLAAFLSVPAAIDFFRDHNWDHVQRECHGHARVARRAIETLTGLPGLCPDSWTWYRQMVSVPLPVSDPKATQHRLYNEFGIEVPVVTWNDQALLRVSIQGYNSGTDVEALIAAVARVLETTPPAAGRDPV